MNGAQDLGGMMGFGPIAPEAGEPLFHAPWEKRALALTIAMGATGTWTLDTSRHARETLPPAEYLAASYYEIWTKGVEKLVVAHGLATPDELTAGRRLAPPTPVKRVLRAADVAAVLARGAPCDRPATAPARYQVGDRVRAKVMHPTTHTRLPRYCRGASGTIHRIHGTHVFPDTNAHGQGETPSWLYSVRFESRDLWGPDGDPTLTVHVDLFEPYLDPA